MSGFYSGEDVSRWDKSYQESISIQLDKLAMELPQQKIDFHLGMLSQSYQTQGMMHIAKQEFREARESFSARVETLCKMYDRFEKGQGRALDAGHFQSFLVAFVTTDEGLIAKFASHYRVDSGTPDSIFLGKALKAVAVGDLDGAKEVLSGKQPRFDPQFVGYAECLEAIANKDEEAFGSALEKASDGWAKWAAKRVKGLPDSVCFIQGAGLVRLAERVIGHRIDITNEYIPQQLLQ